MKIKVNCLSCGFPIQLEDTYEDYEGEVKCWGCQGMNEVVIHEGKVQHMKLCSENQISI